MALKSGSPSLEFELLERSRELEPLIGFRLSFPSFPSPDPPIDQWSREAVVLLEPECIYMYMYMYVCVCVCRCGSAART